MLLSHILLLLLLLLVLLPISVASLQLFAPQLQPTSQLLRPLEQRQQALLQGSGLSCGCSRCRAISHATAAAAVAAAAAAPMILATTIADALWYC
jgi:hypothetical protein